MKAYEIRSFGLENLSRVERPELVPAPGQVRVRLKAASINYRDLLMIKGHYNPRQKLPLIPLSDGVGLIDAVGEGVEDWKPGQRVLGSFCQAWLRGPTPADPRVLKQTLGGPWDGTLAQSTLWNANAIVEAPEHLSDAEAATLPCAALTAWSALVTQGGLQPGDTVVLQGTGGVSIFALQFARMLGASAIITSSSDEKLERAKALGAGGLINYRSTPKWSKVVREMTGDRGADHVVEVGGAGTFSQSARAVRAGGQISLIGVLSGAQGEINLIPILMQNIRVQGVLVGSAEGLRQMCRAIALQKLQPVVDRVFSFEEALEALRYAEQGRHFGKVCIAID